MKQFIKVCGITSQEDALWAATCGATAIGLIFARESPRKIGLEAARKIVSVLPESVQRVGVFVNEPIETVNLYVGELGLAYAQLHGEEGPCYCRSMTSKVIKALRVAERKDLRPMQDYSVEAILLDSFSRERRGGTGKTFNWSLAVEAKGMGVPIILSGGLNPDNVAEAIRLALPAGVDTSSGVEISPGLKDHEKVRAFVNAARAAFAEIPDENSESET
jgi:phosphoribosylanthranilate isomerase